MTPMGEIAKCSTYIITKLIENCNDGAWHKRNNKMFGLRFIKRKYLNLHQNNGTQRKEICGHNLR